MIREAVRQFVDAEIRPRRDELEHGDLPPYDIIRSLFKTFGMDAMARESFKRHVERQRLPPARRDQAGAARAAPQRARRAPAARRRARGPGRCRRRRRRRRRWWWWWWRVDDVAADHRAVPLLA